MKLKMLLTVIVVFQIIILYNFWDGETKLAFRKSRGMIERIFSPGYSCCHRCGRPWKFAKEHITSYSQIRGCFPLCEKCWSELTPKERLPFYKELYTSWQKWGDLDLPKWSLIEDAVLKGK